MNKVFLTIAAAVVAYQNEEVYGGNNSNKTLVCSSDIAATDALSHRGRVIAVVTLTLVAVAAIVGGPFLIRWLKGKCAQRDNKRYSEVATCLEYESPQDDIDNEFDLDLEPSVSDEDDCDV